MNVSRITRDLPIPATHAFYEAEWDEGIVGRIIVAGKVELDGPDDYWYWHGIATEGGQCYVGFPGLNLYQEMGERQFSRPERVEAVLRELAQSL